jgi:hypothetical protein
MRGSLIYSKLRSNGATFGMLAEHGERLAQVYVEVEESPNCAYSPLQTFQALEPPLMSPGVRVASVSGRTGPHDVVGWCSDAGGSPCHVTCVQVTDSGAGSSLLVSGGDFGVRLRPSGNPRPWSIDDADQFGEPYLLLDPAAAIEPLG